MVHKVAGKSRAVPEPTNYFKRTLITVACKTKRANLYTTMQTIYTHPFRNFAHQEKQFSPEYAAYSTLLTLLSEFVLSR